MGIARPALILTCLLALAACAGQSKRKDVGEPVAEIDANTLGLVEAEASPTNLALLDPWEGFNRKVHAVNHVFDRALLRPVAKVYDTVTPRPVRTGISNFFSNLQQPITAMNFILQGHPLQAGTALGRFLINATVGMAGTLDPATSMEIPRRSRDFGQTLAQWGWVESRYVVLPIFGPSTLRDGLGKSGSSTVSPITWLARREGAELTFLYGIDARAGVLPFESMLDDAADPYLMIRDAYLQRRRCQIIDCSGEMPDYLLPDYDFEIPDFDTLR